MQCWSHRLSYLLRWGSENDASSLSPSSMSCSQWGSLRRSSSMAAADGTPPKFNWWTARVPLNLVYPSSIGSTKASSPFETSRMTNLQIDVSAECHVHRHVTLEPGNVSKNRDATGHQHFAQWREAYPLLPLLETDRISFSFSVLKLMVLTVLGQFCFRMKIYLLFSDFFVFGRKRIIHFGRKCIRFQTKMCTLTVCGQSASDHQSASNGHVCDFRRNRGWLVAPVALTYR